jgi:hypothetical protein
MLYIPNFSPVPDGEDKDIRSRNAISCGEVQVNIA